jgi:hypothetical protein
MMRRPSIRIRLEHLETLQRKRAITAGGDMVPVVAVAQRRQVGGQTDAEGNLTGPPIRVQQDVSSTISEYLEGLREWCRNR